MPTRRQQRLNELLFEEISLLIPGRLDDPRLAGATVTRVETTQDMAVAKVYVTEGSAEVTPEEMLAALDHAHGWLQLELSSLGLRRLPRLVFARDKLYESGERVLSLLDQLSAAPADDTSEPRASAAAPDESTGGG